MSEPNSVKLHSPNATLHKAAKKVQGRSWQSSLSKRFMSMSISDTTTVNYPVLFRQDTVTQEMLYFMSSEFPDHFTGVVPNNFPTIS